MYREAPGLSCAGIVRDLPSASFSSLSLSGPRARLRLLLQQPTHKFFTTRIVIELIVNLRVLSAICVFVIDPWVHSGKHSAPSKLRCCHHDISAVPEQRECRIPNGD